MAIVKEYLTLTEKYKSEYGGNSILLYQVGSFYEVYALKDKQGKYIGSNIEDFSKINDMIIAEKAKVIVNKLPVVMAGFGLPQLDKYVKRLQEHGYTIIVYTQDIQGKNTTRSLSEIISPGTYFSTDNNEISNNTLSIWLHKTKETKINDSTITIGLSNIDIFTGKTSIFQITNKYHHNPCTYDDLERYISIYNPKETLIVSNMSKEIINDIILYTNINSKKIHTIILNNDNDNNKDNNDNELNKLCKNAEKQTYQQAIFTQYYPKVSNEYFMTLLTENCIAMQSFTLLLDFIYSHCPNLVNRIALPIFENYTNKLILANHSLKQLNILDDNRYSGRHSSVGKLLNNCVTTMGKRQFSYSLNNPITDIDELNKSYNITEHLLTNEKWLKYREILSSIHDLEKFSRKLVLKKISPKDLAVFSDDLFQLISLFNLTKKDKNLTSFLKNENINNIDKLSNNIITDLSLHFSIQKCYKIDDISIEKLNNLSTDLLTFINLKINDDIDKLLSDCLDSRNKLEAIKDYFSSLIGEIEKKTNSTGYIKIHETPKSEPVLMGTSRRINLLKTQINTINKTNKTHDSNIKIEYLDFNNEKKYFILSVNNLEFNTLGSNKKDLIITNEYINTLSKNILSSSNKLAFEINKFFNKYLEKFLLYQDDITSIIKYAISIDILQSKVYIANKYNYCKPNIVDYHKSFISFTGIRHPLIEHLQTNELYVTNDLSLGNEIDGLLLYGTNAVGKTSLIRSIGISIIMAQAGLYVPCSSFNYFPYTSIFTRILGNDNIFKGLSTFAVEMSELRTILNLADKNSLILGDELCSGTESDSALSIFTSGLEILHNKESTFLFATHFHEIINYDEIQNLNRLSMKHMEVTYDNIKDILIYDRKLRDGPGDSMYGLEVCKSLNLPYDFLKRAHDIRMKYNKMQTNILNQSTSRYNQNKIKTICELCKNKPSTEVHHLQHQQNANIDNSYINSFHKNHLANLLNVCEDCHLILHSSNNEHKLTKTTDGYILTEI
tara:strand:- start:120 stop:3149 length:3030 start_codon:yes stop_codon:yes gene_type:complete